MLKTADNRMVSLITKKDKKVLIFTSPVIYNIFINKKKSCFQQLIKIACYH